jgi:hypothetical protein
MECGRLETTSWENAENAENETKHTSNVVDESEPAVIQSNENTWGQEFRPSLGDKEQTLPYDSNAPRQEKKEFPTEFSMEFPSASSRQTDWRARPTPFMTETRPRRTDYRTPAKPQVDNVVRNITVRLVADAEAEIVPVRLPRRD